MSILRHRSPGPAAAPPLEDEDLLSEILLLLPPEPSSLPRASAVCKLWRRLASDPRFIRRFRLHHHRNPPLLGFFGTHSTTTFQPTLDAPNRVPPGRFSLQRDGRLLALGCRNGLVLLLDHKRKQVLVWDPVTRDQHHIALPPQFDAEKTLINGAVLRVACVYSSETGLWGNLVSTPLPSTSDYPTMVSMCKPAVLVGDSLCWTLIGKFAGILKFDLERQSLAVIQLPLDMSEEDHEFMVMPAEGGGLGFLLLSELRHSAQLWKRRTNCDGVASWELGRTIELDKILSLNSEERENLAILGFAERSNVVFLWTFTGLFMVELESLQFKKFSETNNLCCCKPLESVYAADTGIGGGHGGAELLHNT